MTSEKQFPESITLSGDDVARLFDLTVHSPLVCSGEFETDDVDLLRRIAVTIDVDPEEITPDEFITQYPHRFRAPIICRSRIWLNAAPHPLGAGHGTVSRLETDAECIIRVAEAEAAVPLCNRGSYNRECNLPENDPKHHVNGRDHG